jgi:hypothetical protein
LLPWHQKIADDICLVRSVNTDAINHDPAITFIQTGSQQPGRPCIGSWVNYGLGSENKNLPAFVVMISQKSGINVDQPLFSRLWSSGFLPSNYQGVKFRSGTDPVLFLNDPEGITPATRKNILDLSGQLNAKRAAEVGDPEIETRIAQYEMAFRMQSSVPELTDLSKEPESTYALYGPESKKPGTFAQQCLLARRLVERGVRFVQLYSGGGNFGDSWDAHWDLKENHDQHCGETDKPIAGLLTDLKSRGLLDSTLIIWHGEFGRLPISQRMSGRDHNPYGFTVWLAGGGIKGGTCVGATDEFGLEAVEDRKSVNDLHATMLHLLGFDHTRLTYPHNGRNMRLTDVEGEVIKKIVA